ncbi:MAG: toll/interleukin-1 receptor domain-containing protein [Pirellulaceae bacterium]
MRPIEVFLSHASRDGDAARQIADSLRAHHIPVFFAPQDIVGAQQWQDEILHALRRCDWFIVLLSPVAVQSMWVKREVSFALQQLRLERRIVPLLYQDCDLATFGWLDLFQRIDLRPNVDEGLSELLRIWGLSPRADASS